MERLQLHFTTDEDISGEQQSQIKADLGFYMGFAPSDATLCCCIEKKDQQLTCNLRVHSAKGHLHIHRESKSIEKLLKFVYESLELSLKQWKSNPQQFEKNHKLGTTPCRNSEHQIISCPLHSYGNKNFET